MIGVSQVAARFGQAQRVWNECVQRRIEITVSMLRDMKAVKMLGLVDLMYQLITELRALELHASERFRVLRIWRILICRLLPAMELYLC